VRGMRGFLSATAKFIIKPLVKINVPYSAGAFRIFRYSNRRTFCEYSRSFVLIDALIAISAKRITAIPVRYERHREGKSTYSLKKLAIMTANILLKYGRFPLRIFFAGHSANAEEPPYIISKTVNFPSFDNRSLGEA